MYSIMSDVYVIWIDPIQVINVFENFTGSCPTTDNGPHSMIHGSFGPVNFIFPDMVNIARGRIWACGNEYSDHISLVVREKPCHQGASVKKVYQDHL